MSRSVLEGQVYMHLTREQGNVQVLDRRRTEKFKKKDHEEII